MTRGNTPTQEDLYRSSREVVESFLGKKSIFRLMAAEGHRLFPDDLFDDLFTTRGRRSVPPRIVATVMVLQRLEGLSDREAVERFTFDLRWKYAAGGLDFDYPGFVHTVLVDMRARLRTSAAPERIFERVLGVAKAQGLLGHRRVLDSTPLYDAVATQDTVTLVRSAIRGVLRTSGAPEQALRAVLKRDDDYRTAGKPVCAWDDAEARSQLVDELARDGFAVLEAMEGRELSGALQEACALLATVLGQDLERAEGRYRIARRVAKDRVISTVDPEARHGHKTEARGFDGYKGHIAIDPDCELITATEVTAGNASDLTPAKRLLGDVLGAEPAGLRSEGHATPSNSATPSDAPAPGNSAALSDTATPSASEVPRVEVYGDASYGAAEFVEVLDDHGIKVGTKVQASPAVGGMYSQQDFDIDTARQTVCCPAGQLVTLCLRKDGTQIASFGKRCQGCHLRASCTDSPRGRSINVHPKHALLSATRRHQRTEDWQKNYRAIRPKVERKLAHLMRRRHGGRRARVRGIQRVGADFSLLAASVNLLRLATLGLRQIAFCPSLSPTVPAT